MRIPGFRSSAMIALALVSPAALATQEERLMTLGRVPFLMLVGFAIIVFVAVYFMRLRDKRRAPINRIFERQDAIHSVGPDTTVTECVRMMTAERIGALIVMEGERLAGIFTERDALNKVLAAGRDPLRTKVAEVMTKDPYCIPPTTTVDEAMQVVTQRRIRHLPIVENGKVVAVLSSGDLTHWLVKDRMGEVQELIDLAAR